MAQASRATPSLHPGQAKTIYVRRRLIETLDAVSRTNLVKHTPRVTDRTIDLALSIDSTTLPWSVATPLDWAWAKYVKGYDLWELDVTHGTTTTYTTYCCRCRECADAATRRERQRIAGVAAPRTPLRDPAIRARVQQKIEALRQHATIRHIARVAGVEHGTIRKIAADPNYGIAVSTAASLLSVKVADVLGDEAAKGIMIDSAPTVRHVQSMYALGFPLTWQADQIGTKASFWSLVQRSVVTLDTARRVAALAARVGDRQAVPGDGINPDIIERTRRHARAKGWYPPAAYDDDGNLDYAAIPDHPWAKANEWCASQVEAHYLLSTGLPVGVAAERAGLSKTSLAKRPRHGLSYDDEGNLDYKASAARIRQYADVHGRYAGHQIGPVTAAIELGIIRSDFRVLWGDHPEVIEWVARETETAGNSGQTMDSTHSEAA